MDTFSEIDALPEIDFGTIGRSMPRERRQNGWVEKKGKTVKVWMGFWYVYVAQPDGTEKRLRRKKVVGKCSDMTKGAAEDALREEIRGKRPPTSKATFQQIGEWYQETNKGRWSKKWKSSIKCLFERQINPRLGGRIAADIRKGDVQQAINDIAADPSCNSESIVRKCITHIRAVFDLAVDDELIEKAPPLGKGKLKMPPTRPPAERFLTLGECQQLLDAATAPREHMIVLIFLVLGLRPSELFALRVDDVGEETLRIDQTVIDYHVVDHAKTEGSRTSIPLPSDLRDKLLAYIEEEKIEDFLFPSVVGTAMAPDNFLDRVLKPLGEAAGIPDLNHQVLRRTTATHFQKHGEVKDAQALLRHTSASTTLKHYQKTLEDSLVSGVKGWYEELVDKERGPRLVPPRKRKVS